MTLRDLEIGHFARILSVGGEKTDTVGELRAAITGHQVGDTVEIVLMRGNDKITVNAVLEAIPEQ